MPGVYQGMLGKSILTQEVATTVYKCPADRAATANLLICNPGDQGQGRISVLIYITDKVTGYGPEDMIEPGTYIEPYGTLERTGLVIGPGESLIAISKEGGLVARLHGFLETTSD